MHNRRQMNSLAVLVCATPILITLPEAAWNLSRGRE